MPWRRGVFFCVFFLAYEKSFKNYSVAVTVIDFLNVSIVF